MNYYATGGQANGLKSIAQDLQNKGRNGDTILAHINPQEAAMLKAAGGSGTINPTTGLPEFGMFGIGGGGGFLGTGINKNASDPVSNALSNNPISKAVSQGVQSGAGAIDRGLVSLDKTVGSAIPGGWGTVAQVAGSFMGLPTPVMVGMGALNGSGVMRKGGSFNLQGAIMGGAMAYGAAELGEYARGASEGAAKAVEKVAEEGLSSVSATAAERTAEEIAKNSANQMTNALASESANVLKSVPQPTSFMDNVLSGNISNAASQIGTGISEGASSAYNSGANFLDKATTLDTYKGLGTDASNKLSEYGTNVKETGSGIKNLLGAGEGTSKAAAAQAAKVAAVEGTMKPMMAAGLVAYGGMGLQALDEQRKYLKDQAAAGAISNAEYNAELARINAQADEARGVVAANPLQVNPGTSGISEGPSLYARENANETLYDKNPYGGTTLYAMGGAVNPLDDQTNMPSQTPMTNFDKSGVASMIGNTVPQQMYAAGGGVASGRFLSGGGDGMSDSIKASINGNQEARLADGEFVVPADVVSHIGNGSSKAGAKQLYSMMDRVRQARVGTKKQGKQINPRKYLAA